MYQKFEVGQLFQGKTNFPEGVKFDFDQSGALLFLFFNKPSAKEIESVKSGKLEIGLYQKDEIIFILLKFQGMEWMDAPYSIHLSSPFEFAELQEGLGFGTTIFLVDATTGILKVMRYIGLSTEFSRKLKDAILKQKEMTFDKTLYNKRLNEIYGNYSTSDLVRRAEVFCRIK